MPAVASRAKIDPLKAFMAGAYISGSRQPIPLLSTSFDVTAEGGLALVVTKRRFKNSEEESIEATITFPVPVHATLFALEARVDGRVLKARAQRRDQARNTYEGAIEEGKSAVLHEEVLRGVHMLSVGHIPPGGEIEIVTSWAMTLSIVENRGRLRIPLTVGDIYGRSGLSDADDLAYGGPNQTAELTVRSSDGAVALKGHRLKEGCARVPLNAPIDLEITGWSPRDLHGQAADGREVVLRVEPQVVKADALSVALLIDHSGSMGEVCTAARRRRTKHQAVVEGLIAFAKRLADNDVVDLWEFDSSLAHIGSTVDVPRHPRIKPGAPLSSSEKCTALIDLLSAPSGGTEIGGALSGVIKGSKARDVLLLTDGKSFALDVQMLAQAGRRITVVLVGEDSLEANVGHLAALTGGDIFVAADADVHAVLITALDTLRRRREVPTRVKGMLRQVTTSRANAVVSAEWRKKAERNAGTAMGRAVAAVAASIALPALTPKAATALAEAEGLVTHVTSLVLVDEEGVVQEGLPATRKIALPEPDSLQLSQLFSINVTARSPAIRSAPIGGRGSAAVSWKAFRSRKIPAGFGLDLLQPNAAVLEEDLMDVPLPALPDLALVARQLDWVSSPNKWIAGDLSELEPAAAAIIERAAATLGVIALARRMKIDPVVLLIGLLARSQEAINRTAARVAKAILGKRQVSEVERVSAQLGLEAGNCG
jgi:hypothetical protein